MVCGGTAGVGFGDGQLNRWRAASARAVGTFTAGQSAGIALAAGGRSSADPAHRHHREVIEALAEAVWTGKHSYDIFSVSLAGAAARLLKRKRPWAVATEPAAVFLLTLWRLGWQATSARHLITQAGVGLDLLKLAPKALSTLINQATSAWTDARILGTRQGLFWSAVRPLLGGGRARSWTRWQSNALVSNGI